MYPRPENNIPFALPARRRFLRGIGAMATLALAGRGGSALASAAERTQGLHAGQLSRAADMARGLDQLRSLVVARDGQVHLAEAFRGPPVNRAVNVKSVAKTFVAAVTGAAIDRGILEGTQQPVAGLLADRLPSDPDPRLQAITIDHLLTMRAGLERTSGGLYGRWVASADWVRFALARPFVAEPGGPMLYSTGSYHLLSAVLTRAAGRSLLSLARDWLGAPLDIDIPPWTRDPQGIYLGGNDMALSPMALLRLGELYRLDGRHGGVQVLSRNWVRASWTPRTHSPFSGHDYGYGWFLARARGHDLAYARGYGGQMIHVVPRLGLTVVMTSDPTLPARTGGHVDRLHDLLATGIIPAAERA